jgi:hypothetical protein
MIKYYGIKIPTKREGLPVIWWISTDKSEAWRLFFVNSAPYTLPLCESIKAFEAIGYECVEVIVKEKKKRKYKKTTT